MQIKPIGIDWNTLIDEFKGFEPDREAHGVNCEPFIRSLVSPTPQFVRVLLENRFRNDALHPEQVKILFFFLLQKRYTDRLNLLHFAFNLFDDDCCLPAEIVEQIPFPHEDGIPRYVLRLDPAYEY